MSERECVCVCEGEKAREMVFLSLSISDISALSKEVAALEELSRHLFLEYVELHSSRVSVYREHTPSLHHTVGQHMQWLLLHPNYTLFYMFHVMTGCCMCIGEDSPL